MATDVALVTGGCGCVGFHVVQALLNESSISAVHVFSRKPSQNQHAGATYHTGSIVSEQDVAAVILLVQPTVIFHVASPASAGSAVSSKFFYDVNVKGTQTLLNYAEKSPCTRSFIYTSSSIVVRPPYHNTTETQPLVSLNRIADFDYYTTTKAIADQMVLEANDTSSNLDTCCLRISPIYGERDNQLIPGLIKVLDDSRRYVQIGNNTALFDFLSVKNAARAHVSAYKALSSPETRSSVAGQAFFITDGNGMPFWDFSRKVLAAAGASIPPEKIKVIPAWFLLYLAIGVEWLYWIATFGQRTPQFLRSHNMRYASEEHTWSIEKAKKVLNYQPVDDRDENIRDGVSWYMQHRKEFSE